MHLTKCRLYAVWAIENIPCICLRESGYNLHAVFCASSRTFKGVFNNIFLIYVYAETEGNRDRKRERGREGGRVAEG